MESNQQSSSLLLGRSIASKRATHASRHANRQQKVTLLAIAKKFPASTLRHSSRHDILDQKDAYSKFAKKFPASTTVTHVSRRASLESCTMAPAAFWSPLSSPFLLAFAGLHVNTDTILAPAVADQQTWTVLSSPPYDCSSPYDIKTHVQSLRNVQCLLISFCSPPPTSRRAFSCQP